MSDESKREAVAGAMKRLAEDAENVAGLGAGMLGGERIASDIKTVLSALAAPAEGYVLVPVDRLRDIVTLSSFLRQGGCDAEDLAGLEYAVESAVDIASDLLLAAPTGETGA